MANGSIAARASYNSDGSSWTFDEERVFSADILTPPQYYPAASLTPCQRLLTAILEDAVHCFQENCGARSRKRQVIFHEAQRWLFDGRATGFTSCVTICETLGIDPIRLRGYLRKSMVNKKDGLTAPPMRRRSLISADQEIICPDAQLRRSKRGQKQPAAVYR